MYFSCPMNAHNQKMCICVFIPQIQCVSDYLWKWCIKIHSLRLRRMLLPTVNVTSHSQMVQCVWSGLRRVLRADWKFTTEVSGGRCVTMAGHRPTRRSSADSWASGSAMFFISLPACWLLAALLMVLFCCRSGESVSPRRFGVAAGPILLDDVLCTGKEPTITHCSRKGWLKHDCTHSQDVALVCSPQRSRHGASTSKSSFIHTFYTNFQEMLVITIFVIKSLRPKLCSKIYEYLLHIIINVRIYLKHDWRLHACVTHLYKSICLLEESSIMHTWIYVCQIHRLLCYF